MWCTEQCLKTDIFGEFVPYTPLCGYTTPVSIADTLSSRSRDSAPPVADEAEAQRVQRSARNEPAPSGEVSAGHRKRKGMRSEITNSAFGIPAFGIRATGNTASSVPNPRIPLRTRRERCVQRSEIKFPFLEPCHFAAHPIPPPEEGVSAKPTGVE